MRRINRALELTLAKLDVSSTGRLTKMVLDSTRESADAFSFIISRDFSENYVHN